MKLLILENIRSAYNVGAMFRTADATAVEKIYLVGYTPNPIDRFGRVQPEIQKTSLGASEEIPWEHVDSVSDIVQEIKSKQITLVAVEQTPDAISLPKFIVPKKVAYVLGNEVEGVSKETLQIVDEVVDVPMLGTKESLNVSVTAGVVLYHGHTS